MIKRIRRIKLCIGSFIIIPIMIYLNYHNVKMNAEYFSMGDFLWIDLVAKMADTGLYSDLEKLTACVPFFYGILLTGSWIIAFFDAKQHYLLIRINRRSFFLKKIVLMTGYAFAFSFTYMATLASLFSVLSKERMSANELILYAAIMIYIALVIILFASLVNLLAFRVGVTSSMVLVIILISFLVVIKSEGYILMLNPLCLAAYENRAYAIFNKCIVVWIETLFIEGFLLIKCIKHDILG